MTDIISEVEGALKKAETVVTEVVTKGKTVEQAVVTDVKADAKLVEKTVVADVKDAGTKFAEAYDAAQAAMKDMILAEKQAKLDVKAAALKAKAEFKTAKMIALSGYGFIRRIVYGLFYKMIRDLSKL